MVAFQGVGGVYPAASASQAADVALTKSAAGCGQHGIRVNMLAIGGVDTGWMVSLDDAAQAAWLLSDHSSWVTDAVLAVDGGSLA